MFDTTSSKFSRAAAQLGGDTVVLLRVPPNEAPAIARVPGAGERRLTRGGLPAWKARRVAAYVDANVGTPIRIEDLANLVGLSSSHFSREFKRTFGLPPHAYIMCRRIEVAQELMLTTPATLSEIALSCGMSDQAHFNRSFRRFVGETPHSWRRTRGCAMHDLGFSARGPAGSPERALFDSPLLGYSQEGRTD